MKQVLVLLSGIKSTAFVCREHNLKPDLLSAWKATFLERAPQVFQSEELHRREQMQIAELERLIGQQAMELEILKKGSSSMASHRGSGGQ